MATKNKNKAGSGEEAGKKKMTFTGTLIEDLIATVERVQQTTTLAEAEAIAEMETWFVSGADGAGCDNKLLGVA